VHTNRLLFHHIGLACRHEALTDATERQKLDLLGYCPEGEEWVDDRLGMRGQFMIAEGFAAPRLELVAPHGEQSPVTPWLERGIKLYHLAYLATDLSAEIERLRDRRAKLMLPPTPAVAFGNRHVAFVMLPNLLLIELIEKDYTLRVATI
jgi:methylmalonyl-CoA/ethylmalonyl-CoA epimerase